MIEVLDGGLIGWRSTCAWITLHELLAVDASLVSSSEFVLDVGRNTEAVRHRRMSLTNPVVSFELVVAREFIMPDDSPHPSWK